MELVTSEDIARVTDWQSLVRVAHGMAVEKGWWDDGIAARPLEDIVNNFHAEVSEAWEEYRAGRMATWYADPQAVLSGKLPKPEGFFVELADLLIRIADAAGAHRIDCRPLFYDPISIPASLIIYQLHQHVSNDKYGKAVAVCFDFPIGFESHDLWATIREKLAYNATRPYRHGGKRA
jgi:hypothetical protein